MREFSVGSGTAVLRACEAGRGPDVVLLHAGVADRRSWFEVMAALEGEARCVAYDQRGHGETTYAPERYAPVDDLLAVLDETGVDRAVLVGNSRGGQIAVEAALSHESRVAGLLLIGSAPAGAPFPPPAPELDAISSQIEAAEESGDLALVNELEARIWLDGPLASAGRVTGAARDLFLAMNGAAIAAPPTGEQAPFTPAWDRLPSLTMPVSIVVGSLDAPGLLTAAEATATRIPGATFHELDGMAHLPMLEAPSVVADEIRALLARVDQSGIAATARPPSTRGDGLTPGSVAR